MKKILLALALALASNFSAAVSCQTFAAGDLNYITKLNLIANGCDPISGASSFAFLTLTGTAGGGYLQIPNQSSAPSMPTTSGRIYFDTSNRFSWIGTNGFTSTFITTSNSANRSYTFANRTGTIADDTDLALKAPIASPTFTGTLTAPTIVGTDATDASSSTTGASKTAGGLGIAKSLWVGTTASIATSVTSPAFIGGSGTTQTLTYKTTTGVGASGADHIFQVGNNGATEAMRILNSGKVGVGITGPLTPLHVQGAEVTSRGEFQLDDTAAQTTGTGGMLSFGGKYTNAGAYTSGVAIRAAKTNATDGNYSFDTVFLNFVSAAPSMTERLRIGYDGHIKSSGTSPALTTCGTSPAIFGSDTAGIVIMGTGAPTGCTITFASAYTGNGPTCTVTSQSQLTSFSYSTSLTAITTVQTATSSNRINYVCMQL